jgi:L-alanine-DL-glutamate epimerase-like enolase superfamily enzyme
MWERPAELASELLDEGIGAMKLYTFRPAALKTLGTYISGAEMARAIEPLERIRESVGGDMDLMMDLVFDWTLAPAQRIVRALDEFDLLWIEDPLRWGARRSHGVLQRQTKTPIAAFDYAVGLESYLDLLRGEGVSIARIDPQWAGGISEAATIARLADAVGIGVVFHDCAGPLSFLASVHLAIHCPNTVLQESVRGYWRAVYPAIVTHTPVFDNGRAAPPSDAGLGAELSDEYLALPDLRVMRSDGRDAGVVTEVRA